MLSCVQGSGSATNYTLLKEPMPRALRGHTLGIIGYGMLGQAVGTMAEAFGMKLLIAEHKGADVIREGRLSFDETIQMSDITVLLCPLTEETRGLIGQEELRAMPRHALLINCARGGIVDDTALAEAIQSGEIAGAGVDVLNQEPPRDDNPLLIQSTSRSGAEEPDCDAPCRMGERGGLGNSGRATDRER